MIKVLRPVNKKNPLTGGYSSSHKGYDHDDKPDANYKSSIFGKVVQAKNSETRNWKINKASDPYKINGKRSLKTVDYGNYIKIKGEVEGKIVCQLGAHFEQGSVLPKGSEVDAGQIVAKIGNTGNSTGSHCHTEYRDEDDKNFPVEFIDSIEIIRDIYLATRGPEYPASQAEVDRWIQENKNIIQITESILDSDSKAKKRWLEKWGIEIDTNKDFQIEQYKSFVYKLKETARKVGINQGADFAQLLSKFEWVVTEYLRLKKEKEPKKIYKLKDRDYSLLFKIWELAVIIEGGD
jgi:hypothetical protein